MSEKEKEALSLCEEMFGAGVPAAAVMGNIAVETGDSFDYTQKQAKGGPERGLFQMEGVLLKEYNTFLISNKLADSARSQVTFAAREVASGHVIGAGNAKKIRDAFESGKVELATEVFCNLFERPGVPHLDRRIEAAKRYL